MRVLILGASGMLGHKLVEQLSPHHELFGTFRTARCHPDRNQGFTRIDDVVAQDLESLVLAFAQARPEVVVNCIGLVKLLRPSRREMIEVNAAFPHRVHSLCLATGARLIQMSTDAVFSGRVGGYCESTPPDPVDDYGRSKLLGEVEENALTLRTALLGPELGTRNGLLSRFSAFRGRNIRVFRQAVLSGLTTLEASRLLLCVIDQHPDLHGVYHVASQPICKFDLANKVNLAAKLGMVVEPDDNFVRDRSLDGSRFQQATSYVAPDWDTMLREMIDDEPLS